MMFVQTFKERFGAHRNHAKILFCLEYVIQNINFYIKKYLRANIENVIEKSMLSQIHCVVLINLLARINLDNFNINTGIPYM